MKYQDFVIEATRPAVVQVDGQWTRSFDVRVLRTSRFGDVPAPPVSTGCDEARLAELLKKLDARDLDRDGLFTLGRLLAALLLPATNGINGVRELLARTLDGLADDEGLRLRLALPPELASLPWEYLYLDRTGGSEDTMNGFIALDPRIAIVRHEGLPAGAVLEPLEGDISVLAAMAGNAELGPLDLQGEERLLRDAFAGRDGLHLEVVQQATLARLVAPLAKAQVFHFAGHGTFRKTPGPVAGVVTGQGLLALEDELIDAEKLGINLRERDIQLVVLGGCETGRRVGPYTAGSIAAGLARAEIPAVVANQFSILDSSAKEFARAFYGALDGGLPLERALHAGRLAIYNADPANRDWGVPVLYLRAPHGELFVGAAEPASREAARESAEARVIVRAREVGRGGIVTGAKLHSTLDRKLDVQVTIAGAVYGRVTGLEKRDGEWAASIDVKLDVGDVGEGGEVTGAVFGGDEPAVSRNPSRPRHRAKPAPAAMPPSVAMPAPQALPPSPPTRMAPMPPPPPGATSTVNVENLNGGTAIGTQYNSTTIVNHAPARDPDTGLIRENLRLDARAPTRVVLEEAFELRVQIKLPESPPLADAGGEQIASMDGSVFRREESEVVNYKIVPGGDGFTFDPPSLRVKLYPKAESPVLVFEGIARKPGQRKLRVNAYQDEDTLAAQTALLLEIGIAAAPP
jgi:hypothetical protein